MVNIVKLQHGRMAKRFVSGGSEIVHEMDHETG